MNNTEAGHGEHHIYRIVPTTSPNPPVLTPGKHYLGVDAVAWYVNKEGSFFSDRMASGTLQITLSSGQETYHAALGTFELKRGAKTAPVFDQPVLPDRSFLGGPIAFNASLTAIKKDTMLAGLLKSAGTASLGIVAGMVQTATVAGPTKILAAAGEALVNGVTKVLTDTGEKREPFFDFSGLQYAMQPSQLVGNEIFILMHRGAALKEADLSVKPDGQLFLPLLSGTVLLDGAWLLLRLRRSDEYSGVREWQTQAKALRGKVAALVSDVEADVTTKDDGLKRLKPSPTGDATYFDEFARLRSVIQSDGVLCEREAGLFVGQLSAIMAAARKAISDHSVATFEGLTKGLAVSLRNGTPGTGPIATAFADHVLSLSKFRGGKLNILAANDVRGDLFKTMQFLPRGLKGFA